MSKLTIKVENFRRLRSNSLFGFIDIVIPEMHLRIREATVHESHGKRWVGLPGICTDLGPRFGQRPKRYTRGRPQACGCHRCHNSRIKPDIPA